MWFSSWADLFARPNTTTVTPATKTPPEPGLYAAWWSYTVNGEPHRLSCSHIHQDRRSAESCAASVNTTVQRVLTEHTSSVGFNYVAVRLAAHPDHQYDGVRLEEEIL